MARWYFYVHGTLTSEARSALDGPDFWDVTEGGMTTTTGSAPVGPATVPGYHVHVNAEDGDEATEQLTTALTAAGTPFSIDQGPVPHPESAG